jgi:hypothetical protein
VWKYFDIWLWVPYGTIGGKKKIQLYQMKCFGRGVIWVHFFNLPITQAKVGYEVCFEPV